MPNMSNSIPIDIAREIARQGDTRLMALMNLATAADLRATTLCGIFGAAGVAIGAALLAYISTDHAYRGLIISGSLVTLLLFAGAFMAALAGAPRDFYIAGGDPDSLRNWVWDGSEWRDEAALLDATGQRLAEAIEKNRRILESGTNRINIALWLAASAPIVGVIVYFVARCL